jgi:hypothetical protein
MTDNVTPIRPTGPIRSNDDTSRRILAFLASVVPYSGQTDAHYRGRAVIERMAVGAAETDYPACCLTAEQCADVLHFLATVQPREPRTWWDDPKDAPSHVCGYHAVLAALSASLEAAPMEVRQ